MGLERAGQIKIVLQRNLGFGLLKSCYGVGEWIQRVNVRYC